MSARALRTVLAGSIGLALVAAGGAAAAPKPVCELIKDEKGDASFLGTAPNDASLDITSADVAADAKTLTGVLRVDKFSAVSPTSPLGRGYYLLFNAPSAEFPIYLNLQITPDLTRFTWGTQETLPSGSGRYVAKGAATGVVDAAKNELRISVPLKDIASAINVKLRPGSKLSSLTANTTSVIGTSVSGGLVATIDDAAASKPYAVGTASCVKPGA